MKLVSGQRFAEGLVTEEIVAQDRRAALGIKGPVPDHPALRGLDFAILFLMPILGHDELRFEREHLRPTRLHQHRGQPSVKIMGLPSGESPLITLSTMDFPRRKIPRPIQRDQQRLLKSAIAPEFTGAL